MNATLLVSWPAALVALVLGALVCFAGYRFRKVSAGLVALALGAAFGYRIAAEFTTTGYALLAGAIVGIVLLLVCVFLYNAGVFILCGGCAVFFCALILAQYTLPWYANLIISLVVFVAVGVLSVKFMRPVMIFSTALSGAGSMLAALAALLNITLPYTTALTLALGAVGIVVQALTTKKE
ncbi:MAG: DUF4203 domain-containing protein [Gemmiger sp.]|nr:DUF4203 domain-containing protein [Gemmiger sp.]